VNPTPEWVAVGRITRAHGVKGEVAVLVLSEVAERFEPGSRLFTDETGERSLTVSAVRPHRQRLLVQFAEVARRDQAEALQGSYLFVPASSAPELPEGEFWTHDLIGCEMLLVTGRSLGRIQEVIHTAANDVWVARGPEGEVLVPALNAVVERVDLGARRVVVHEVPGLTVPEEPAP
jgi:16S rRNA processing protein RimM